jgi:type IV pilus assembly protein PilW
VTAIHPTSPSRTAQGGLTLVELMVAMVLGLIVAGGVVAIFSSTSSSNRAQTQLARLQEEGRFAVTRLKQDLSMANGQYCTNSGGVAKPAAASQVYLDGLRTPIVYAKDVIPAIADVTTKWGTTSGTNTYPATPSAQYSMPSYLFMRGYDCGLTSASCKPIDPNSAVAGIPSMGKAVGNRVIGTDVITVRYVNADRGWAVGNGGTTIATAASTGSAITSITIAPASSSEPPATDFTAGDMAMLADCSNAQVFAVTKSGAATLVPDSTNNWAAPAPQQPLSAPKLFDFNRDFQTVTYYVKVVDNGNGQTTGALVRRVNGGPVKPDGTANPGGSEDELVRGVERLDFRYGVQDVDGKVRYLTAGDVDAATGISCPPGEVNKITSVGCLWRAVTSIEMNLVIDGQIPLYTLTPNELAYTYGIDGKTTPAVPTAHAVKPSDQGFVDPMLRREFTALVSVRNFNP